MIHPKPICHVHTHAHTHARYDGNILLYCIYCSITHYIDDIIRL